MGRSSDRCKSDPVRVHQCSFYKLHEGGIVISYPIRTSVLLPSHPLFPAADNIYVHVGSTWSADITPALGGPGTMRNGTFEWAWLCACLRS
jgi:hypothetical protein